MKRITNPPPTPSHNPNSRNQTNAHRAGLPGERHHHGRARLDLLHRHHVARQLRLHRAPPRLPARHAQRALGRCVWDFAFGCVWVVVAKWQGVDSTFLTHPNELIRTSLLPLTHSAERLHGHSVGLRRDSIHERDRHLVLAAAAQEGQGMMRGGGTCAQDKTTHAYCKTGS